MFAQDLIDTFVVFLMFVLRIGVPVALTLAFGYWLEKKLAPREQARTQDALRVQTERRGTRTGKIIQIHCWNLKRCASAKRAQCAAYKHPELPCWLALQAEGEKVRADCFSCALYKPQTKAA